MSTKQSEGPTRAERLTSLIYALATNERQWTSERIGKYLNPEGTEEARQKAIERAKDEIRNEFGLRLLAEDHGGVVHYRIDTTDWYLPAIEFSAAESALIALASSLWKDSKLQSLALNATSRITGETHTEADIAPYLGTYLPRLSMDDPNFKDCALAVFNRKTVHFSYRAANGQKSRRILDVWGIGQRFGYWYFTGWDHTRADTRVFRLSRVVGKITLGNAPKTGGGYRKRPAGFSMSQVLQDFDLHNPAHLATIELHGQAAMPLQARALERDGDTITLAYADLEAQATELASYGPNLKVLSPLELAARVRELLAAARQAQEQAITGLGSGTVKYHPTRAAGRTSTASQVMRNIDMIQYVVAHGVATVDELAQRYGMTAAKVRQELSLIMMCGVPGGQHDELINVNDGDLDSESVSISNAALLAEPQKLAPMEAVAVLGGLNALASIPDFEHRSTLDSALGKINDAVARYEGWNGALGFALSQVQEQDSDMMLATAIREHRVVEIDYYSPKAGSHQLRLVEPVRIFEDGDLRYLRGYCRTRQQLLTFRLDRILQARATEESFEPTARHRDDTRIELRYNASEADVEVELYLHQDVLPVIEAYKPIAWSSKVGSGYLAKVRFSHHSVLAPLLARHAGRIAVVAPQSTADQVNLWLDSAMQVYEDGA
ncbi:WYL domain-containing protein [Glutamicibacter sp. MNS18]|uniref:helix-turn-helix transcriptional regulator n=1 Tax=Glutamicibacter sp. MNS18 TaxID=2989817 RepID=UPI0022358749|nr:WYL domain-containing protein [Glutamicibacter sp. MNS18]MCW4464891.1 WYL domain-containing protein [Glutamicibacter sp. MNS18]